MWQAGWYSSDFAEDVALLKDGGLLLVGSTAPYPAGSRSSARRRRRAPTTATFGPCAPTPRGCSCAHESISSRSCVRERGRRQRDLAWAAPLRQGRRHRPDLRRHQHEGEAAPAPPRGDHGGARPDPRRPSDRPKILPPRRHTDDQQVRRQPDRPRGQVRALVAGTAALKTPE